MMIGWLVLALLVVLGTWAVALLLVWSLWIPIVVTSLVVAASVLGLSLRYMLSRRRSAALEVELRRQAAPRSEHIDPARSAAVIEIRAQVREVAMSCKRSKLWALGGNTALYSVPWLLLIGHPRSGKSAALKGSGLALSLAGGRPDASRPGQSTPGCQPWLCEAGVLFDTSGRYALGDDGDAEWTALLEALKRQRRRKALDGIILIYSASELAGDRPEQLEDKAKRLRARLDELGARLGMVLPVYLVITKLDLLPGFLEFYAGLPVEKSLRLWGATLDPTGGEPEDATSRFKAEFDLIKSALHAYLLEQLPARREAPEVIAKVLRFPMEFEGLRAPLARLVDELFRASRYREAAYFRGFYFSSSGGELAGFEGAAGLGFKAQAATQFAANTSLAPAVGRSYFLSDVFSRVIFPDRDLATRSKHRVGIERRQQLLLAATAFALLLIGVLPPTLSLVSNLELIDATRQDVDRARLTHGQPASAEVQSVALDVLLARLQKLEAEANRFSVRRYWGPYTASPLRDSVRLLYLDRLQDVVRGPLRNRSSDALRAASDVPGLDPAGFEATYRQLQLYLMLAHPDKLNRQFATPELAKTWSAAIGPAASGAATAVDTHVRNYLDALSADPSWAWPEDGILVARARAQLASMPLEELEYSTLVNAAAGAPPVLPEHIFTGEAARYVTTRGKVEVPGLYTALGWQKVQPLLKRDASVEFAPWVIAPRVEEAPAWGADQLTKLYFDRYIRAWMDFLVGLDIATPTTLGGAIEELAALSKGEGPYVRLFRRLGENVRLEMAPLPLEAQVLAKVSQVTSTGQATPVLPERRLSPVEQYYRRTLRFGFGDAAPAQGVEPPPSLLSQYLDQLRSLEVSLRQLQDAATEPTTEFRSELARTSATVERLMAGFEQTERLAFEPLLLNPIRGSQRIVEDKGRTALSDRWRVEVWEPYRRLVTRYPFVSTSSDVPLPDFGEFFRPQTGTFWRFYEEVLATRFMRSGARFVPHPSEAKSGFTGGFLECLASAQQISDAAFVDGSAQPMVPFKVKMQSVDARVSQTILKVDGQSLVYRNEPEKWQTLEWPGKDGPAGASLRVKGADFDALVRREDGDFGLFRLLTAGNVKPISPGSVTLEASWTWSLNGADSRVIIQFQASRQRHPFLPGFFSHLNCPAVIAAGPAR